MRAKEELIQTLGCRWQYDNKLLYICHSSSYTTYLQLRHLSRSNPMIVALSPICQRPRVYCVRLPRECECGDAAGYRSDAIPSCLNTSRASEGVIVYALIQMRTRAELGRETRVRDDSQSPPPMLPRSRIGILYIAEYPAVPRICRPFYI